MCNDFIPSGGNRVDYNDLGPGYKTDSPSARCFTVVGEDIQSGPIYCGERAVFRAHNDIGYVNWCEQHVPRRFREAAEPKGEK